MENIWRIWIDTGGTFTDCLACSPDGEWKRVKVLSISSLRGVLCEALTDHIWRVSGLPPMPSDFFCGYSFYLLGGASIERKIIGYSPENQLITLDGPIDIPVFPASFELTAGEEAPILAARLATETPLSAPLPPLEMRLGSTKGTNALLERKIAPTVLLTTQGFADLPLIGTQQRPDLFSLAIRKPLPLHSHALEVAERINAHGEVVQPLTDAEIGRVIHQLRQWASPETAIAIALMHSYRNPAHELQLSEALTKAGFAHISLSHALAPSIRLLARTQTAVVNACLSPVIERYISGIRNALDNSPLRVMTSAGGLVGSAFFHPKDSLLSGPAGGIVGAVESARLAGHSRLISFDMGGTSTDVARYAGAFDYQYETAVGDARLFSPTLAIHTVAAGGGSICQFDGYKLTVGPESAGAAPGPACYGAGGPLTITDINLLLGRIAPQQFSIPLFPHKAREALRGIAAQMTDPSGESAAGSDLSDQETALLTGFLQIANEKMAEAIRKISVSKGYDPVEHALLAFGGAGGQHACVLADLLQMRTVLVPYDAGLLSAWGMGQAALERVAIRQVLRVWPTEANQAPDWLANEVATADQEALSALANEQGVEQAHIRERTVSLRFQGQDHAIEVAFLDKNTLLYDFLGQYRQLYGFVPAQRAIEVVAVRVVAAIAPELPEIPPLPEAVAPPAPEGTQLCWTAQRWQPVPVYRWETLPIGCVMEGPALIVSNNSTLFLETGWEAILDARRTFQLTKKVNVLPTHEGRGGAEDLTDRRLQLELFTNRFTAIAEEMGAMLQRTAFSVNVKERLDFSCALLDPAGELVVNAPHIPVHLGSLGLCVRSVVQALPLGLGDVAITNHPAFGGSHLPDITLIKGVFGPNGQLLGYVANRAHHAEIGGTRPGSMPPDAVSLQEEGVVIAPQYLQKNGHYEWERIAELFTLAPFPTRSYTENHVDLMAQVAALHRGEAALLTLVEQHGAASVLTYMGELKRHAALLLSDRLRQLGDWEAHAREYLDDGWPICVAIRAKNAQLHIDFTGTGPVHPRNFNATPAILHSAVMYVLRLLVDQPLPLNEGLMQPVTLHLPEGLLNPHFSADAEKCPAVVGGNTETSQRVVDTLLKALGLAACSQGTMNNLLFGNDRFGYYETIGGGTGAGNGFHGADAVHQHMTNTRMTDPEVMEFRYPVVVERFAIRRGSGGAGQWRGGDGIARKLRFLVPVELTILAQHRQQAPYGLAGGEAGHVGQQGIHYADGTYEALPGTATRSLQAGDAVEILTPGGGGFGAADS